MAGKKVNLNVLICVENKLLQRSKSDSGPLMATYTKGTTPRGKEELEGC